MDKEVTKGRSGILFRHQKKEILSLVTTSRDLESIMLNEMPDRKRQKVYELTYIWNLKNKPKVKYSYKKMITFVVLRGRRY